MTGILPGLFVGTIADARAFGDGMSRVVCVLNQWPWDGYPGALWIPVVVADADNLAKPIQALPRNLDVVADVIQDARQHRGVLVHCREGVERSPLAVAWYLVTERGMMLDDAYALLRVLRPEVVDRRAWLP